MTKRLNTNKEALLMRGLSVKVSKQYGDSLSLRTIQRIIAKGIPDDYGVLNIALKIAKKDLSEKEKVAKKLALLKNQHRSLLKK